MGHLPKLQQLIPVSTASHKWQASYFWAVFPGYSFMPLVQGNNVTTGPGGRFSKDPVTYRARKAILETMIRLPWKAALLICFRYKERQNNCQVSKLETCSYWRYKGIYLTRKVSGRSRNGPLLPIPEFEAMPTTKPSHLHKTISRRRWSKVSDNIVISLI